ncbi:hypothetical protein C725_2311 [Pacificimonas flava]|uniref:Uncharacterized protein n=1 Tax=Pacificimonas flava TaxID=1234595 RepID=M2U313_9SPHN|nr:hypothetical protein C725_2311 [Pacificimonas flava]
MYLLSSTARVGARPISQHCTGMGDGPAGADDLVLIPDCSEAGEIGAGRSEVKRSAGRFSSKSDYSSQ